MLTRGHLFIPILMVLFGLILGYSAPLCALVGALSCLPLALLQAIDAYGHHLAHDSGGARGRREEHPRGGHSLRHRRNRHRLRHHHRPGHRVHADGRGPGAGHADPRPDPDRARRHRPRHGHAHDPGLHHDGGPAGSRGDQARDCRVPGADHRRVQGGRHAGGAHVRVLLRYPVGDHPACRARGVRGGEPCKGRHVGLGLRRHAGRGAGLHRAVHVRLRADAAAHRQRLGCADGRSSCGR